MVRGGGWAWVGLAPTVQVRDGLQQLCLCLLQKPVDVLGAVLGQGCPLFLPVPLGSLERRGRQSGLKWLPCSWTFGASATHARSGKEASHLVRASGFSLSITRFPCEPGIPPSLQTTLGINLDLLLDILFCLTEHIIYSYASTTLP